MRRFPRSPERGHLLGQGYAGYPAPNLRGASPALTLLIASVARLFRASSTPRVALIEIATSGEDTEERHEATALRAGAAHDATEAGKHAAMMSASGVRPHPGHVVADAPGTNSRIVTSPTVSNGSKSGEARRGAARNGG
jgi:hypothetical protein